MRSAFTALIPVCHRSAYDQTGQSPKAASVAKKCVSNGLPVLGYVILSTMVCTSVSSQSSFSTCTKIRLYRISAPAPANPESDHFFGNPAKSGFGQISSRICHMPVQLQYVQLIMLRTNADNNDVMWCIHSLN